MITIDEIIRRIKDKHFKITYEEAIDLQLVMDISYTWVRYLGGDQRLDRIYIDNYDVYFYIEEK